MRTAGLFIVLTASACGTPAIQQSRESGPELTIDALELRGTGLHGGFGGGPGDADFGVDGPGGGNPFETQTVVPGDYTQQVVEVYEGWDGRDDLYAGALSTVTITEGPTGASLHGFVDLVPAAGELMGSGLLIEINPSHDCSAEWLQAVEGQVQSDGHITLHISEVVAVAGKQCGLTDLGDAHLEENEYLVTLTPM